MSGHEEQIHIRAGCKINIFLRITGIRADGYHELDTLFLPVTEPHDELRIQPRKTARQNALTVRCSTSGIDLQRNTLTSAYEHFALATSWRPSLDVELIKGIPHGAGLGGGSSDAAALLRYLQQHCPTPPNNATMQQIALRVGADVPFFLENVPRLASSVGETLAPCPAEWNALRSLFLVLVCPSVHVSTAWAFAEWDRQYRESTAIAELRTQKKQKKWRDFVVDTLTENAKPDKNYRSCFGVLFSSNDIVNNPVDNAVDFMGLLVAENNFEPVVFAHHAELGQIKAQLFQEGAAAACMSGSGAALFGLFRQEMVARSAVAVLRKQGVSVFGPCLAMPEMQDQ